jgi:hypothetical protein
MAKSKWILVLGDIVFTGTDEEFAEVQRVTRYELHHDTLDAADEAGEKSGWDWIVIGPGGYSGHITFTA